MAQNNIPILDFIIEDTHDAKTLAIRDISFYPQNFNIISPFLQVEVPGKGSVSLSFTPNTTNVLNSTILSITKTGDSLSELPDGIYSIKYSINPAYQNYTTKNIVRVDKLNNKFDSIFINIISNDWDVQKLRNNRMKLNEAEFYTQGAIAAANRCANKLAMELYRKASCLLDELEKCCHG